MAALKLWVNRIEETVISLLLAGMTLLVFLEVVLRFGFNTGFLWAQELTLHMSAWFVLFGASYGLKVGAHLGVDVLVSRLTPAHQRWVSMAAVVGCLIYCGLFIYGSWVYLAKMKKIGIEMEDLPIPVWIAQSILIIGLTMLVVRLLQLLWGIYKGETTGFKHTDEAEESMRLAQSLKEEQG